MGPDRLIGSKALHDHEQGIPCMAHPAARAHPRCAASAPCRGGTLMADSRTPKIRRTRASKQTLRRLARTPLARELAELANALQSRKLHLIAEKVAKGEAQAAALDAFMVTVKGGPLEAIRKEGIP